MISKKIYKLPFPFTDLSSKKARPALALTEPDEFGDIKFVFITTKNSPLHAGTIDVPEGLLHFPSKIHTKKIYVLNQSIILKELTVLDDITFEKVLKSISLDDAKMYYKAIHEDRQNQDFVNGKTRIPYAGRVFNENEITNLIDSSLEFWLTSGRYTEEFEKKFGNYLNVPYCSLVNSGSSANLLAFMALTSPLLGERQIKRGDEVITVACGFPTTVTPIIQYGAIPVFLDVTIPQYNIDVTKLETALSTKTKAIMIAHTLGNPFDLKTITEFCKKHNLWLIEDNCDALGSEYTIDGLTKNTGTWGDIGTSSFYPPHHMTMGEGGAVYTSNPILHKIIRSMRDWGRDCICPSGHDNKCGHRFNQQYGELPLGYDHKYVYSHFGYNLKTTDMQAAVGCAQIEKLSLFTTTRRKNWQYLKDNLLDLQDKLILPEPIENSLPSWFGFMLTCKKDIDRNRLVKQLENEKIQTRALFAGNLIKHPCFDQMRKSNTGYKIIGELTDTNTIMNSSFWIGVYPGMTKKMLDKMIEVIHGALQNS